MQHESAKRTALEQNLHAQLLLQSETMMAMELKLLRLEAQVERRREVAPVTTRLSSQQQLQRASIPSPVVRSLPAPPTPETRQQLSIRPRTTCLSQQQQHAQNSSNNNTNSINNNNNITEQLTNAAVHSSGARSTTESSVEDNRKDNGGSQQSSKLLRPCILWFVTATVYCALLELTNSPHFATCTFLW